MTGELLMTQRARRTRVTRPVVNQAPGYSRARFTIEKAYDALALAPWRGVDRRRFYAALRKARLADQGHEHEYGYGSDPFLGDLLSDLAYENVRMWLRAAP
ncbi:MAG TPA: hypothetical protein PKV96_02280 [Candidatus Saccharimonas sp.]|jgi:hypothetical protein|nr:hypothetical protein [Candidatus Saccharimonas sp.]